MKKSDTLSVPRTLKTGPAPVAEPGIAALFFGPLCARWKRSRKLARDERLLQGFPDHLLKDIGLQRIGTSHISNVRFSNPFAEDREKRK